MRGAKYGPDSCRCKASQGVRVQHVVCFVLRRAVSCRKSTWLNTEDSGYSVQSPCGRMPSLDRYFTVQSRIVRWKFGNGAKIYSSVQVPPAIAQSNTKYSSIQVPRNSESGAGVQEMGARFTAVSAIVSLVGTRFTAISKYRAIVSVMRGYKRWVQTFDNPTCNTVTKYSSRTTASIE